MSARVVPEDARFRGAVTCERTLTTSEVLPERLTHLLEQSAEIRWLRDRRVTLRLVERALEVGAQVYVTGVAHGITTVATVESLELAATGTDGPLFDYVPASQGGGFGGTHPGLWIEAQEPLEEVVVSSEPPTLAQLQPPVWSLALLVIGPLLTLVGLFYLARAAAPLMTGRL